MKRMISWCMMAALAFGGVAIVGCSPSSDDGRTKAGGNGEFGEDPGHAGSHAGDYNNSSASTPSGGGSQSK